MIDARNRNRTPVPGGRAFFFPLLLLLSALAPPACQRDPGGASMGIVDATRTPVDVPSRPARIVSLLPSVTEALFRLGAGDRVVGVTAYCNRPAEAAEREKVGTYIRPDLEKILALRPDLLLAGKVENPDPIFRLREIGVCVFVMPDMNNFDEVRRGYILLGRLAGVEAEARRGIEQVTKRLAEVRARLDGRNPVATFIQVGGSPLYTTGTKSCVDDVLRHAGGVNATAGLGEGYLKVEVETVLSLNPEAILITTMAGFPEVEKQNWMKFKSLSAVRSKRVRLVNGDDMCRPDPFAFASAVEEVAKILHPEAFGE